MCHIAGNQSLIPKYTWVAWPVFRGSASANTKAKIICGYRSIWGGDRGGVLYAANVPFSILNTQNWISIWTKLFANYSKTPVVLSWRVQNSQHRLTHFLLVQPSKCRAISRDLVGHFDCCRMSQCIKFVINQRNSERNHILYFPRGLQGPLY